MFKYQQDNIGYKAEEFSTVIKSTKAFHCIETLYLKNCWYKHDTGFDNGFKMLCESCSCLRPFQKPVTIKSIHPQFQINRFQKEVHIPFFCLNYHRVIFKYLLPLRQNGYSVMGYDSGV